MRGVALAALLGLVACTSAPPADGAAPPSVAAPASAAAPASTDTARAPEIQAQLEAALAAQGPDYRPRTRHLEPDGRPKYLNRLIKEHSPYLLQHAHNPVDWWPWGEEAFAAARALDRPVLLSVGYSTCRWCHVMERESFEDEAIAAYINAHFIAIKVDREERPDVDSLYMHAVIALTGQGGWPMTVMLTPDRAPFFGGTYFPPRAGERGARKGFSEILQEISKGWETDRAGMLARAKDVSTQMAAAAAPHPPGDMPGPEAIEAGARWLARQYDARFGGFSRAPKFPRPTGPALLLRYFRRTGDATARTMVVETLHRMAEGGVRDQLGGGFHRYSVDGRWHIPHFEKMLYDNAQLAVLYLEGYQASGDAALATVARAVLDDMLGLLAAPDGTFYSATDAESPTTDGSDTEGAFFTWTPAEIDAALPDPAAAAAVRAWYAVETRGELDGRNVLHTPRSAEAVARQLSITEAQLAATIAAARPVLLTARAKRPPPLTDTKRITGWNGLMLTALATAAQVLDEPRYLAAATRLADVLVGLRDARGRLLRIAGGALPGVLDDYAAVIEGLITLFEVSGDARYLTEAQALQAVLDRDFADPVGGYFLTAADGEALAVREKPNDDGALPAGNSVAALNLLRLHALTGDAALLQRAERLMAAFSVSMPGMPRLMAALDFALDRPREIVVVAANRAAAAPLLAVLQTTWLPNRVVVPLLDGPHPTVGQVPLVEDKVAVDGRPTAYVCEAGRCERPTSDSAVFAEQLGRVHPLMGERVPAPLPMP